MSASEDRGCVGDLKEVSPPASGDVATESYKNVGASPIGYIVVFGECGRAVPLPPGEVSRSAG